uniref:Uncharacterized protein n=1 Tax=Arundo donax TaxID=35708 RepID=A0A0A9BIV4_ARUDO
MIGFLIFNHPKHYSSQI